MKVLRDLIFADLTEHPYVAKQYIILTLGVQSSENCAALLIKYNLLSVVKVGSVTVSGNRSVI